MEKLLVCRICLSENVGSRSVVNNVLQEFYEKMTSLAFKTEDRRPIVMCYICLAQLIKAHTLNLDCLAAEKQFALILDAESKKHDIIALIDKPKTKLSIKVLEQVQIDSTDNEEISTNQIDIDAVHIKQETSSENDPLLDGEDTIEFELDAFKLELKCEADANDNEGTTCYVPAKVSSAKEENMTRLLNKTKLDEEITDTHGKFDGIVHRRKRNTATKKTNKIDTDEIIPITSNNRNFDTYYKCKICNQQCNSHDEIDKHNEYHNNVGDNLENVSRPSKFDCHLCTKSFRYKSALNRHILTHTGEKPFKCANCHKSFAENSNMIKHIRIKHPEVFSFTCHRCQKTFDDSSSLKTHLRTHTGDEAYKCDICEAGFKRKSELKVHSITHGKKPYKCGMCEKHYKNRNFLETHIRVAHTDEKRYKCDKCHLAFKQSYQLKIHTRQHTGEKPYKCNTCQKDFSYRTVLINHMRTHTGEKPFKCDQCWKAFRQYAQLSTHIRIHTGERPYKCKTCSKCFIQPSDLKKHVRIHTGERPYKCNICPTAFVQHYPWVLHMRSHTGEKPYACDVCQKRFRSHARLKKHSVIHTGEKPFKCNICHRDFGVKSTLRRHARIVHNVVSRQTSVKTAE